MTHKTQVLSTATLGEPLITKAAENDVVIDCVQFIQVNMIEDISLLTIIDALCESHITAVFTSANAVAAISRHLAIAKPDWNIYCIEGATKEAVLNYFPATAIKGTAKDATELAKVIVTDSVTGVVFFCGDSRMDTLPGILQQEEVGIREVTVYETIKTPQMVGKVYDGILFFSPSAVEGFFSANKIAANTILFAIGNTTGKAIGAACSNKVVVSTDPSKESVVSQAIAYYHKEAIAAVKD